MLADVARPGVDEADVVVAAEHVDAAGEEVGLDEVVRVDEREELAARSVGAGVPRRREPLVRRAHDAEVRRPVARQALEERTARVVVAAVVDDDDLERRVRRRSEARERLGEIRGEVVERHDDREEPGLLVRPRRGERRRLDDGGAREDAASPLGLARFAGHRRGR
jgi:hypothetical protein